MLPTKFRFIGEDFLDNESYILFIATVNVFVALNTSTVAKKKVYMINYLQ
jgi:hypothetical protein